MYSHSTSGKQLKKLKCINLIVKILNDKCVYCIQHKVQLDVPYLKATNQLNANILVCILAVM